MNNPNFLINLREKIRLSPIFLSLFYIIFFIIFFGGGRETTAKTLILVSPLILLYFLLKQGSKKPVIIPSLKFNIFLPLTGFLILMLASLFWTTDVYDGLEWSFFILSFIIVSFCLYSLLQKKEDIQNLGVLVLFLGIIFSLIALYFFLESENFQYLRAISTYYYHLPFAGFLLFVIPIAFGFFLDRRFQKYRFFALLILIILLITFYFAHSRGAWIALVLVLPPFLFLTRAGFNKKTFFQILIVLFISTAAIKGILLVKDYQASLADTQVDLAPAETSQENALQARLIFWKGAWEIFKEKPIFGAGIQSFKALFKQNIDQPFYYSTDPHNFYLKILAELGITGFFLFLWFLAILLIISFKILRWARKEKEFLIIGIVISVFAELLYNGVGINMWEYPANLFLFFLLSAGLFKLFFIVHPENFQQKSFPKLKPALLFFSIIPFIFGASIFISNFYYQKAEVEKDELKFRESLEDYARAIKFNPIDPTYRFKFAESEILENLSSKAFSKAKENIEVALRMSEHDTRVLRLLFQINFLEQNKVLAIANLDKALEYNPLLNLDLYVDKTLLFYLKKKNKDWRAIQKFLTPVLDKYSQIDVFSPRYTNPNLSKTTAQLSLLHFWRGESFLATNQKTKAEEDFKKAIYYSSSADFAYRGLILLEKENGKMDLAMVLLKEGLENNPQSKILQELKSSLEQVQ